MAGTSLEDAIKEAVKNPLDRDGLRGYLTQVLELGSSKIDRRGVSASAQLGWARVMVSAVVAGTALERDRDLDQLSEEVEQIKKALGASKEGSADHER